MDERVDMWIDDGQTDGRTDRWEIGRVADDLVHTHIYSLFTVRRARSPLLVNGQRALLMVNRLYDRDENSEDGAVDIRDATSMHPRR